MGEGKHLRFRVRDVARPRRRLRRSRSASARSSTATGASAATTSPSACEENRWNGTVSPQLVVRRIFDAAERLRGRSATGSKTQWKLDAAARSPDAAAVFAELELEHGWRSLFESERFRALLAAAAARPRRLTAPSAAVVRTIVRVVAIALLLAAAGACTAAAAPPVRVTVAGKPAAPVAGRAWTIRLAVRPASYRGAVRVSANGPKRLAARARGGRGAYRATLVLPVRRPLDAHAPARAGGRRGSAPSR